MKLTLVAPCLFGLEKQLGEEIDSLGLRRLSTIDGRVTFEGTEIDVPRLNIGLRLAERVMIELGSFSATSFDELFEGVRALPWEAWIGKDFAFPVSGHSIKSKLTSVPDCQKIIKKAVVNRLSANYGIEWFEETGVTVPIEFFLFKDEAHLMIDTTGTTLHKRGYRTEAGGAPIRETLAASLVLTAHPRNDILFWDPMCGSGTIAIEAALIQKNVAPGLRRSFLGESFPIFAPDLWKEARDIAKSQIKNDADFTVYASDIDENVLAVCRANAERAGIADHLKIFRKDVREIKKQEGKGTVICNPPYGERLLTVKECEELYRDMGKAFEDLSPWQIYVITSHGDFERLYGRRADKTKKLYNGMIPCTLYEYFKPHTKEELSTLKRFSDRRSEDKKRTSMKPFPKKLQEK